MDRGRLGRRIQVDKVWPIWWGCFLLATLIFSWHRQYEADGPDLFLASSSGDEVQHSPKWAYGSFLSEPNANMKEGEEDHYFVATRMLIYQLLHNENIKSDREISFMVLVAPKVTVEKRDRLIKDGAKVIEVPDIRPGWVKPGTARWASMMSKLAIYRMVDYEKVLMLDSDIVVQKRLDGAFESVAARELPNLRREGQLRDDEGVQPDTYIMAASPDTIRRDYFNAGFMVIKPSEILYQHFLSTMSHPKRFRSWYMEQNLLNYVHRSTGNLPWQHLDSNWTVSNPRYSDHLQGKATLHGKFWSDTLDSDLKALLNTQREEMESYWQARETES